MMLDEGKPVAQKLTSLEAQELLGLLTDDDLVQLIKVMIDKDPEFLNKIT